jgi:hypothetical protein
MKPDTILTLNQNRELEERRDSVSQDMMAPCKEHIIFDLQGKRSAE